MTISNNRASIIRTRLQDTFSPSYLEVVDESDQHIGHAGHQGGGRHFAVIISAKCFNLLTRVEAHKKIYALLTDLMPEQVHALRIKIIKESGIDTS